MKRKIVLLEIDSYDDLCGPCAAFHLCPWDASHRSGADEREAECKNAEKDYADLISRILTGEETISWLKTKLTDTENGLSLQRELIGKLRIAGNALEDRIGCGCTDLPCEACSAAQDAWLSLQPNQAINR